MVNQDGEKLRSNQRLPNSALIGDWRTVALYMIYIYTMCSIIMVRSKIRVASTIFRSFDSIMIHTCHETGSRDEIAARLTYNAMMSLGEYAIA